MSQCVPNWDLDDGLPNPSTATTTTANIHAPTSDYVVSELTWEKVHASKDGFHGSPTRRAAKLPQKRPPAGGDPSWEKHHANGTLEAVVDQACTRALVSEAVDALVPSAKLHDQLEHLPPARVVPDVVAGVVAAAAAAASGGGGRKRARAGAAAGDGYSRSATGSGASAGFTFDSCDINGDGGEETGFAASTSPLDGSTPETEHASCGRALTAVSEEDDSYDSRRPSQKYVSDEEEKNEKERSSPMPIRRIRVAAVHNQSERKRRDRINQRMRTLQKLVPNSSKCDKASILDEVIDYMRQLQAQVQMMSSMSPAMMMPMAAMQQMQMAVMAQMAQMAQMGMAMGMGMPDMGQPGMPSWAAAAAAAGFLPPSLPRDIRDYPTPQASAGAGAFPAPDPFAAYMAFQTQQRMAMDARSRMAAGVLCQRRPHQQPPPGSTNENQSRGNVL